MKKFFTTCESCGKKIEENGNHVDEEGNAYCSACAEILRETCVCCGNKFQQWEMTSTDDGDCFCEHCATAI